MKIINKFPTMYGIILLIIWGGCGQATTPSNKVNSIPSIQQENPISNRRENPIRGTWNVFKAVDGYITGMSEDEANAFIGKQAMLTDSTFIFESDTLTNVRFEVKKVEAMKYFMGFKTDPKKLGIADTSIQLVEIFRMDDKSHSSVKDLIWINDKVILPKDGYFFFLKK